MIIFLFGQDTYRSSERLHVLRDAFISKFDPKGHNVATLYGDEMKVEDFHKVVFSQGLLSKKRFVMVKNCVGAKKTKAFFEEMTEQVKEAKKIEDVIVVFWEGSDLAGAKKENKLYSYLSKTDNAHEYKSLDARELHKWILQTVKKLGGSISPSAIEFLVINLGSDLWSQSHEIEKLIAYKDGKMIDLSDVEQFISLALNDNIFHFTDALANKNAKMAAKLFEDQLNSGANEFYLITMLARQLRILLQLKEGVEKGCSSQELQQQTKLHPYIIKKSLSQVRKFSLLELKKLYNRLLFIDTKLKTSGIEPKVLFDLFIVEACS